MNIFNRSSFQKISIVVFISLLSGCVAAPVALTALSLAPAGMVAYQYLPGGTEVELSKPDGGTVNQSAMKETRSVVTANKFAYEYLDNNRDTLFKKVTLIKEQPLTSYSAAAAARKNGAGAFITVDVTGANFQAGFLSHTKIYGSARVTVITNKGDVIYEQTASLKQKMSSASNLSDNEVFEILARVIVDDMKKGLQTASAPPPEEKSWLGKFLP